MLKRPGLLPVLWPGRLGFCRRAYCVLYGRQMFKAKHLEEPLVWIDQLEELAGGLNLIKKEVDATMQVVAVCASPAVREMMEAGKHEDVDKAVD